MTPRSKDRFQVESQEIGFSVEQDQRFKGQWMQASTMDADEQQEWVRLRRRFTCLGNLIAFKGVEDDILRALGDIDEFEFLVVDYFRCDEEIARMDQLLGNIDGALAVINQKYQALQKSGMALQHKRKILPTDFAGTPSTVDCEVASFAFNSPTESLCFFRDCGNNLITTSAGSRMYEAITEASRFTGSDHNENAKRQYEEDFGRFGWNVSSEIVGEAVAQSAFINGLSHDTLNLSKKFIYGALKTLVDLRARVLEMKSRLGMVKIEGPVVGRIAELMGQAEGK